MKWINCFAKKWFWYSWQRGQFEHQRNGWVISTVNLRRLVNDSIDSSFEKVNLPLLCKRSIFWSKIWFISLGEKVFQIWSKIKAFTNSFSVFQTFFELNLFRPIFPSFYVTQLLKIFDDDGLRTPILWWQNWLLYPTNVSFAFPDSVTRFGKTTPLWRNVTQNYCHFGGFDLYLEIFLCH